jgi:hypothetical protein
MMRELAILGVLSLVALAACDEKLATFFAPIDGLVVPPGAITTSVTIDGSPAEVGVTIQRNGTTVATGTTTGGTFSRGELTPGTYTVSITPPTGVTPARPRREPSKRSPSYRGRPRKSASRAHARPRPATSPAP